MYCTHTNTGKLCILNLKLAMNGHGYYCMMSYDGCEATSNSTNLTVNDSNGVNDIGAGGLALEAYRNPTQANCQLDNSEQLMRKILISHDITGKVITEQIIQNTQHSLPKTLWDCGLYYMSVSGKTRRLMMVL